MRYEYFLNAFNIFYFTDESELKEGIVHDKEQIAENNLLKEDDILAHFNTPFFIDKIYNTLDEKDGKYYEMLLYLANNIGEIKKIEKDYLIILKKEKLEKTLKERFENFKEFLTQKLKKMKFIKILYLKLN